MPRSKFNVVKAEMRMAIALAKRNHAAILIDFSADDFIWVNTKHHRVISPSRDTHHRLVHTPTKWSIYQAVMCEDQFGAQYLKSQSIEVSEPYKYRDLVEHGRDAFCKLVESCNESHRRGVYQLCSPFQREWPEEDMFNLLTKTGVFKDENESAA